MRRLKERRWKKRIEKRRERNRRRMKKGLYERSGLGEKNKE